MKDKSKVLLVAVILLVTAAIAYVCYGIFKGKQNPVVTMEVSYKDSEGNEKKGTVKIELYPESAPESVNNFIALANNGYYDGLTFHRIVKNFVVQGGDKNGDGSGSAKLSDINKSIQAGSTNDYTYSSTAIHTESQSSRDDSRVGTFHVRAHFRSACKQVLHVLQPQAFAGESQENQRQMASSLLRKERD